MGYSLRIPGKLVLETSNVLISRPPRRGVPYEFNLPSYLKASKKVPTDDLAWDQVREHPLCRGELRFLRYMMNIEAHTIVYLKELLSTSAIEDDDVTAFLSCWAYEEFFHGAALERFLREYAGDEAARHGATSRLANGSRFGRAMKKVLSPVVSAAAPDFVATHMTWGATQELTTLHGYQSLARQSRHPVLKELMARIVRDERRHFAFYYNQAERRLQETPSMRRITRLAMDRLWRPVGVGTMPAVESDFTSWFLFRDGEGLDAVRAVDATMAQLPGMQGWQGLTRTTLASIKATEARERAVAAWSREEVPPARVPAPAPVLAA